MQWLIIGISGITCSGKTTLANSLREYFQSQQNQHLLETTYKVGEVHMYSQDDYFLPVTDKRHQYVRRLNAINYELMSSIDMEKMLTDIAWTLKGAQNSREQPQQDHNHQNKQKYMTSKQRQRQEKLVRQEKEIQKLHMLQHIQQNMSCKFIKNQLFTMRNSMQDTDVVNILIIEGFIIFNHQAIFYLCNIKFHFHLPYEKCYERRLKRTYDPPDVVGYFEMCVWPHYEQSLRKYKHCKDIIYLNGEIERERIFKFVVQKLAESTFWNVLDNEQTSLNAVLQHHCGTNNNNNNNNNSNVNNNRNFHFEPQGQQQPARPTIVQKMTH